MVSSDVIRGAGCSPFSTISEDEDSVDVWHSAFASIPRRVRFLGVGPVVMHSNSTASLAVLRGSARFSFAPIPWQGTFRVRVALVLCFDLTVRVIPWDWGIQSLLHSHRVLGWPQRRCHFFLHSNAKAGEIPDLLHYSPNLKICSNWQPPYHHEAGRLSAYHVNLWIFWSWWKKGMHQNQYD